MPTTATTHGARDHARSQAGKSAETRQTIPASSAANLPVGVEAANVLWDETLGAGGYASRILRRGSTLRLIDLEGDACAHFLVFNADRPHERLNIADTVKVQWNAYPARGALLLSDMGRVLISVLDDTRGRNDAFCGPSTPWTHEKKYGTSAGDPDHPSARDRFTIALSKHGLEKRDICPGITFFKGVRVGADGSLTYISDPGAAGDAIDLRAEMNVLVVVANCPHPLDPRKHYAASPLRLTAWRGEPTSRADPLWSATPEGERAFLNTEDYFLQ